MEKIKKIELMECCVNIKCPVHHQSIESIDVSQGIEINKRILCHRCEQKSNNVIRIQKVEQDLLKFQNRFDQMIEQNEKIILNVISNLTKLLKEIEQFIQSKWRQLDQLNDIILSEANKYYKEVPLIKVMTPFCNSEYNAKLSDISNLAQFLAELQYKGQPEEYEIQEEFNQLQPVLQQLKSFDTVGYQINMKWEQKCRQPFEELTNKYKLKEIHWNVNCINCKSNPIIGIRYICNQCPYFNMCEDCYNKKLVHQDDHYFIPLETLQKERLYKELKIKQTAIHKSSICSSCGQNPIIGIKYICKVCSKFYYCEKCHNKSKQHVATHSFIQVENEEQNKNYLEKLQKLCIGQDIHNMKCKGCSKNRFYGIRYRCQICNDYDCCQQCYDKHNKKHNFIELIHYCNIICEGCGQQQIMGRVFKCQKCANFNLCYYCYKQRPHLKDHKFDTIKNEQYGEIGK